MDVMRILRTTSALGLTIGLLIAAGSPPAIGAVHDHGYPNRCRSPQDGSGAGWYDLRAYHASCWVARGVARRFWQSGGDPDRGWRCRTRRLGERAASASCTRFRERHQHLLFAFRPSSLISGEQVVSGPLGTKPFDTFARPDGDIGAEWISTDGSPFVIDHGTIKNAGGWTSAAWGIPYPAPHEVFATLIAEPKVDDDYCYLELLDDPDVESANGYALEFDNDYWDLFRNDDGSWTRLNAWSWIHDADYFRSGETAAMAIEGSDVVAYRLRDGIWQELGRATDVTHRPSQFYRVVEMAPQDYIRLDNVGGTGAT